MYEKMTDDWILEHQNKYRYWKFEKLRPVLIAAAMVPGVLYVLLRRQSLILTVLCLLIPIICVILDFLFPAYFTLLHSKREMEENTRVSRISLMAPCFYSLGLLAVATHLNFHFASIFALLFSGVIFAVVVTAVLFLILPECRANGREMAVLLILTAVVGFGITGQLNYWLDTGEQEAVQAVVTEIDDNYRSHKIKYAGATNILVELMGVIYTCTVTLPDGTEARFSMGQVGDIGIGDTAILLRGDGALGLECYTLGRMK